MQIGLLCSLAPVRRRETKGDEGRRSMWRKKHDPGRWKRRLKTGNSPHVLFIIRFAFRNVVTDPFRDVTSDSMLKGSSDGADNLGGS
jgi:hypothetical protein